MIKYTSDLYAKIGGKYCKTGKSGQDWDKVNDIIQSLSIAISAYQNSASVDVHMDGTYTITGWTPTKLNKAYEIGRIALKEIRLLDSTS